MDAALRARAARLARLNGLSILLVAGVATLLGAAADLPTLCGAVIALGGALEWRAGTALAAGAAPGSQRPRLVAAELGVLAGIVVYAVARLSTFDAVAELAALPADQRALLESALGGDLKYFAPLLDQAMRLTWWTLIGVTLVYQGGFAWWYWTRVRNPE